ncbi:hypothetical protein I5M32_02230 [Pedobacter sp. SD-b]|uniref:TspO and MBR related proteins n=1 Tax=Pedobacter segetis TaxID=2793069 RepID=A0ABS1BFW7_9SPHI|nr:hypothetical protein [Pedobacter segetis]MBK0381765.1 hypothetical protein [Pedobacter segetis]
MKKVKSLAILNLVFFVIAFTVSNLSQLKIFGGVTNADISDKYATVFTPAGITFAIWGLIYLSLFGFTIYHLIKAYKDNVHSEASQAILKIGNLFIINNIATTFWVFAFTYEYLLVSMILIIIQLITLLMIFIKLNLFDIDKSFYNKLFTQFPLSIYFAWLCVANVANISLYLTSIGWSGFGIPESLWAQIMIIVIALVSFFIVVFKRNVFFGLVAVWSVYGIRIKRVQIDDVLYSSVINVCDFALGFIAIIVISMIIKNIIYKKKEISQNA